MPLPPGAPTHIFSSLPTLPTAISLLNAVGYDLVAVPKGAFK